jgi:hypothetical protein
MRRFSWGSALLALAVALAPRSAWAARSSFGWLFDVETNPERGVEMETWMLEEDGRGDPAVDETSLWWGPVVGITDRVQIALPVEIVFEGDGTASATQIDHFGAELRWHLTNPDPVEGGPFASVLRVGARRLVTERGRVELEGGLILGYDVGRLRLLADLEWIVVMGDGDTEVQARPGLGVSARAWRELRLGAELYSEIVLNEGGDRWYSAGPNLAWTHGRFWLSGSFLVGLSGIDAAPRVNWGVAF